MLVRLTVPLARWLPLRRRDWPARVASWLPAGGGPDAWFVRREVADPTSPAGREQTREWLSWLDAHSARALASTAPGELVRRELRIPAEWTR